MPRQRKHKKNGDETPTTPSFVLTLKLRYTSQQRARLDKMFKVAGFMYNNLVADRKKVFQYPDYRRNQEAIEDLYKQMSKNKTDQKENNKKQKELQEQLKQENLNKTVKQYLKEQLKESKMEVRKLKKEFKELEKKRTLLLKNRRKLLEKYGMNDDAFQKRINSRWRHHYEKLIGVHVAQNIASQVWRKFYDYLFGKGKEIRFMPWQDFSSLEGKACDKAKRIKEKQEELAKATNPEEQKKALAKLENAINSGDGTNIVFHLLRKEISVAEMNISVLIPDKPYETEALKNRVKYCRIIRIPWKDGWLYKLQLVMEGIAPFKKKIGTIPATDDKPERMLIEDSRHPIGKGRVGLDIGPQTLAYVSEYAFEDKSLEEEGEEKGEVETGIGLKELADKANNPELKLARINRALDQSRRATNPEFFDEDGQIIRRDKLNPELLNKRKKRKWKNSAHYEELSQLRRYYYAKAARTRKCQHQTLANKLLLCGDEFYIEKIDFRAWAKNKKSEKEKTAEAQQKQTTSQSVSTTIIEAVQATTVADNADKKPVNAKETKKSKRNKSRKRFGKSIGNKAPGMFVSILEQKITDRVGSFTKIDTVKARASQYNHVTKEYIQQKGWKSLKKRWKDMPDGRDVQRDLYSAFLIMNTNATYDGFIQELCESTFDNFVLAHDKEFKRLLELNPDKKQKKHKQPASMGLAEAKTRLADRLAKLAS